MTKVALSGRDRLELAAWHLRDWIGRSLGRRPKAQAARLRSIARLDAGPLTDDEIDAIVSFQVAKVGADHAARMKQISLMQRLATELVDEELTKGHIGSIANIGARVDYVSAQLAPKYPDIDFVSVDFQPDLDRHNAGFDRAPNWRFRSGYALRLFQAGDLRTDAVVMTSTSVLFTPLELDAYLAAFRSAGVKTVILNEPWWWNGLHITTPERLKRSIPAGAHGNYHHPYPAALDRNGYAVSTSRIVRVGNDPFCALQITANTG